MDTEGERQEARPLGIPDPGDGPTPAQSKWRAMKFLPGAYADLLAAIHRRCAVLSI